MDAPLTGAVDNRTCIVSEKGLSLREIGAMYGRLFPVPGKDSGMQLTVMFDLSGVIDEIRKGLV